MYQPAHQNQQQSFRRIVQVICPASTRLQLRWKQFQCLYHCHFHSQQPLQLSFQFPLWLTRLLVFHCQSQYFQSQFPWRSQFLPKNHPRHPQHWWRRWVTHPTAAACLGSIFSVLVVGNVDFSVVYGPSMDVKEDIRQWIDNCMEIDKV